MRKHTILFLAANPSGTDRLALDREARAIQVELERSRVLIPDLAGWRRERLPRLPDSRPVRVRPDWVCEIVSPTSARRDRVRKMNVYHAAGVPHYWLIDPQDETLTVYRWTAEGYLHVLGATREDRVRAEVEKLQ